MTAMAQHSQHPVTSKTSVASNADGAAYGDHALQIRTILVPIDFSRESFRVSRPIRVARKFGAIIHLLNVRPSKAEAAVERAKNLMMNYADGLTFVCYRLADIERKHDIKFAPENCHVFAGRPSEEIRGVASKIHADLVALATHGESGVRDVVLGSTAEHVIRCAPCPVLIPRGKTYESALAAEHNKYRSRDYEHPGPYGLFGLLRRRRQLRQLFSRKVKREAPSLPRCLSGARCGRWESRVAQSIDPC